MKSLLLICSGLLLIGMMNLPIGFYTLLRIVVTIGSIAVVVTEFENGFNFWVIAFGLTAIIFNPIIPVYLNDKAVWMPIDIFCSILFVVKAFAKNKVKEL